MESSNFKYPPPLIAAIKLAEHSQYKHRHGATLVKHGRIIGKGINSIRHHKYSKFYQYQCACHAETAAILNYGGDVRKSTVFVARINKQGTVRHSMPCPNCWDLLHSLGVAQVCYTTEDGFKRERI